mmetsp:Transcript_10979/g.15264  ORF Transcript_10979/g.15264 Transcript_10979/m.15264 type:complete len:515 (-) Transcript_10979:153-1697(-)
MRNFVINVALLCLVANGIIVPWHRKENSGLEVQEGEFQSLPFIRVEAGNADLVRDRIEKAGGWWTQINQKIYSPIAAMIEIANDSNSTSLIAKESSVSTRLAMKIEDMYVAVGGTPDDLPSDFKVRRVGGSGPFHFLHLHGMDEMKRNKIIEDHRTANGVNPGSRHTFAALIKLESGFTPFKEFVPSPTYRTSLSAEQVQAESSGVKNILEKDLLKYLKNLVGFGTRAIDKANAPQVKAYIQNQFEEAGLKTCQQPVMVNGILSHNVLAFLPSASTDASFVILGAHYDSRPFEGAAPGAEDNGSGSAALLTIARTMGKAGIANKHHVVFSAFTGEELGLYGSGAFVNEFGTWGSECSKVVAGFSKSSFLQVEEKTVANTSQSSSSLLSEYCKAAIIMDEIGWASDKFPEHTVTLETREFSQPYMEHLAAASGEYNGKSSELGKLNIQSSYTPFGSDHMPFLNNGRPAVLTINGDDEAYPNYHKPTDTIENVNLKLATKIARMNFAALLRMANED